MHVDLLDTIDIESCGGKGKVGHVLVHRTKDMICVRTYSSARCLLSLQWSRGIQIGVVVSLLFHWNDEWRSTRGCTVALIIKMETSLRFCG